MATHKDALKRLRQNKKRNARNRHYKSMMRTQIKKFRTAAEAGEVANKVKKIMRDGDFDREAIADEIGDCLWYIAALCRDLNVDMENGGYSNLEKLHSRQKRGTLRGNGDKR